MSRPRLNETTVLKPGEVRTFLRWAAKHKIRDLDHPDSHYDYRGAFRDRVTPDEQGHWPDTYKQHGHETFSTDSKYSKGPKDGGRWVNGTFVPAKKAIEGP